jgi:integrase
MSAGHIQARGVGTWRLKFEVDRDPATGKRRIRYVTVKGTKREAQAELTRLLAARDAGTAVEPDKITVGEYMRSWVTTAEAASISPKTAERYRQLIMHQITPHLGAVPLQKLKGSHIASWHATLLREGGRGKLSGAPLSARTVGHAHRLLHKALGDAVKRELLFRNPVGLISPPKVAAVEMTILDAGHIKTVLDAIQQTSIYPQVVVLLATGMRRGELTALQWGDIDFDGKKIRVERSIEKTTAGLRVKGPKTAHGRRLIALPEIAAASPKATSESRAGDTFRAGCRTTPGRRLRLRHDRGSAPRPRSYYAGLEALHGRAGPSQGHVAGPSAQSCVCAHCGRYGRGHRLAAPRSRQSRGDAGCLQSPVRQRRRRRGSGD